MKAHLVGLVCLFAFAGAAHATLSGMAEPVSGQAVAELKLDKDKYFFGEPFRVEFVLRNTDDKEISYSAGSDYRANGRPMRFRVQAVDADGEAVPLAAVSMGGVGGGLGGSRYVLKPGEAWRTELWPLDYLRLTKSGKYTLRITHDLGWMGETGKRSEFVPLGTADTPFVPENWTPPIAEAQVEFVMPDERQAEKIVDEISLLVQMDKENGKRQFIPPVRDFAFPVYLPFLERHAQVGEKFFLEALEEIATKEATLALLELAENENFADAAAAAYLLSKRMPLPQQRMGGHMERLFLPQANIEMMMNHGAELDKLAKNEDYDAIHLLLRKAHTPLLEAVWEERFTPRAREIARRLVSSFNPDAPEPKPPNDNIPGYFRSQRTMVSEFKDVDLGVQMLASIGTAEDYEVLRDALEKAFPLARTQQRQKPNTSVRSSPAPMTKLIEALDALRERGAELKSQPSGNAELFLYFHRLAKTPPPRPPEWLELAQKHWTTASYPIRTAILESIPQPVPPECRDLICNALDGWRKNVDYSTVSAACEAAARSGDTVFLPAVLAICKDEDTDWVFRSAYAAVEKLGTRRDLAEALTERLRLREQSYHGALGGLIHLAMEMGNDFSSIGSGGSPTSDDLLSMQAAWRKWIAQHAADIEAEKKFQLGDDANLPRELFGNVTWWNFPDGKRWPEERK